MTRRITNNERGSIMLTTVVSIFALIGMLGLSVDLGRVYIAKHEAQAYADITAVSAVRHLNGKQTGIDAAAAELTNSTNKWNFDTQLFDASIRLIEYSTAQTGPWQATPTNGGGSKPFANYAYVRVTATPSVNLAFLPAVGTALTQQVTGQAVAGIVPQTFPAGGYLPFTPFAHNPSDPTGNFGFSIGEEYGFLWPGNISNMPQGENNACHGDTVDSNEVDNWPLYNSSDNTVVGGSQRGYFQLQAASAISDAILGGTQTDPLAVNDYITLTNGQKQAEQNALATRASYDTDPAPYVYDTTGTSPVVNGQTYHGNDMRLVVMPVNDRNIVNGTVKVIGFASFLLPLSYPNGGNKAWCAIYMGSMTEGGDGSGTPFNVGGAYVVRLVQ
jgi:Flp pilus assembly protein TadG